MRLPTLPRTPVGIAYVAALALSGLTSLALGGALWARASQLPSVILVRSDDDPRVVMPGIIPDALARDFARDFVGLLENYGPATVERNLAFLETRIAPQTFHEFRNMTVALKKLVQESKQASQLLFDGPAAATVVREKGRIEVVLRGSRRIYVENALLQEGKIAYRVALIPGEPSRENPTGLLVAGFAVRMGEERAKEEGQREK